jgi:hypothetical protein
MRIVPEILYLPRNLANILHFFELVLFFFLNNHVFNVYDLFILHHIKGDNLDEQSLHHHDVGWHGHGDHWKVNDDLKWIYCPNYMVKRTHHEGAYCCSTDHKPFNGRRCCLRIRFQISILIRVLHLLRYIYRHGSFILM